MKKFGLVIAVVGVATVGMAVGPRADAAVKAPQGQVVTQCLVPDVTSSAVVDGPSLPSCETFTGLCFVVAQPTGPARVAHGAAVRQAEPCAGFSPECTVQVVPQRGPSRLTHVPGGFNVVGPLSPGDLFTVPPACLELASTGFDAAPAVMFGLALFGAGSVLTTLSRRRRAARVPVRVRR